MASTYNKTDTSIGFDDGDWSYYFKIEAAPGGDGLSVYTFNPPTLTRTNVTELRDWLTAWLERTK